jgi:uncharacterized protein (DUF2147 family)
MKPTTAIFSSIFVAAALVAAPTIAQDTSPVGIWEIDSGESRYQVETCGDGTQLCAKLVWLRDDARTAENLAYLDTYVVEGARFNGANAWQGQVNYEGDTFDGRLTMVDADTIRLNGCKGIFCKSMELERI